MIEVMVIQGRELHAEDIGLIRSLLAEHGDWGRTRISEELCRRWDWRNGQGRFKDMAARTLLLKLERAGLIQLPKRRSPSTNGFRNRNQPLVAHATESIRGALSDLRPLAVSIVEPGSADLRLFNCLFLPLSLPRPSHHGRREHPVSGARPHGAAGGLRVVRLGGLEVRGARCLDRLGSRQTGGEPRFPD